MSPSTWGSEPPRRKSSAGFVLIMVLLVLVGCCRDEDDRKQRLGRAARLARVAALRAEGAALLHPSDGGGLAEIDRDACPSRVERRGVVRCRFVFEVGPRGIDVGGSVYFQVPRYYGWSSPQVAAPERAGFTHVETSASGVVLASRGLDDRALQIEIRGRSLRPGEKIEIVYGAGPQRAISDRYAEHGERFLLAVDGNGDGVKGWIDSVLSIDIGPGAPARLVLSLPATARPGEQVPLTLAVLDDVGNAGVDFVGSLKLAASEGDATIPDSVEIRPGDRGLASVDIVTHGEGVVRLRATGPGELSGTSNPMSVSAGARRILWGDLHGHSNFSDGSGTPDDYFRYARDVAALDVAALTDHDHWGVQPLVDRPEAWQGIQEAASSFDQSGRFVALPGYEWTNWIHGHRHVIYFGGDGRIFDALDPRFESPAQLWAALRDQLALTFSHHSAGGPVPTDWNSPPPADLEPVTEIVSILGSSEAPDSPAPISNPVSGNFVRDVLDRGIRLGFVGSGDTHNGHPGLSHLTVPSGGLAAILSESVTRKGVLDALKARRVYATNGPRIILTTELGGSLMGAVLRARALDPPMLRIEVVAVAPIDHVDIVRSGEVALRLEGHGRRQLHFREHISDIQAGGYLYVRVVQSDGGAAWSSPFFFE